MDGWDKNLVYYYFNSVNTILVAGIMSSAEIFSRTRKATGSYKFYFTIRNEAKAKHRFEV